MYIRCREGQWKRDVRILAKKEKEHFKKDSKKYLNNLKGFQGKIL